MRALKGVARRVGQRNNGDNTYALMDTRDKYASKRFTARNNVSEPKERLVPTMSIHSTTLARRSTVK